MQLIKTVREIQSVSKWFRCEGKAIGFVPTMGALHEGHLSLVRRSLEDNDRTIVSIFVNPSQFGPDEDFQHYPRDPDSDMEKLSALPVDVVFMPDREEMYPEEFSVSVDIGNIGHILCGISRPGHFSGVATIVAKLFNSIMPRRAYFGQKDYQQTVVIKKLVKELNYDIECIVCPTVRESDGLAMSSRNAYLSEEERRASLVLYRALQSGEELIKSGGMDDVSMVKKEVEAVIKSEPLAKIDYVDIVDPHNLAPIQKLIFAAVICLAVRIGASRLIDNIIVEKN